MLDAEKDRVDDRVLERVLENGHKRETIKEDLDDQKQHDPYRILQEGKTIRNSIGKINKIEFVSEEESCNQNDDPEKNALFETVLEFSEVCLVHHRILAADDLQTNAVERAEGRADGDDRNACEKE